MPFDAAQCSGATLDELDVEGMYRFIRTARRANSHGTEIAKPIPSYRTYKGTVFELADQAVDFVLSKIVRSVGTRANSEQAPVAYEMPKEGAKEAMVNAVAHRVYTDNSSVQVMRCAHRREGI
ncbi:MAG: hypothetical protein OXN97_08675 [Bryobacterales bacterium]|nr:hypothetical protein [Bryobacterales bacterium]